MDHEERRSLVEQLLEDLRAQREVDLREVLMELIHLSFELDDEVAALRGRVDELQADAGE